MGYSFSLFQPRKSRRGSPNITQESMVEIRTSGRIFFNRQALALLENRHFCMLGYDPANKAIGIPPTSEKESDAFPVRYTVKGAYIGAKKFSHFNLLPGSSLQTTPSKTGEFIALKW